MSPRNNKVNSNGCPQILGYFEIWGLNGIVLAKIFEEKVTIFFRVFFFQVFLLIIHGEQQILFTFGEVIKSQFIHINIYFIVINLESLCCHHISNFYFNGRSHGSRQQYNQRKSDPTFGHNLGVQISLAFFYLLYQVI